MRRLLPAITLASLLLSAGCSENSKPPVQSPAEKTQDEEIQELKKRVAALEQKPVQHHYELRTEGSRSFRFDPDTGESCVKLATTSDWKKPETIRQGCPYQDFLTAPLKPGQDYATRHNAAECIYVGNCIPAK